jgi:N-acetylglucosaminyl-diphospho-decaprenol L-rhamnosyltransferase
LISVSIVSHGQGALVRRLLADLNRIPAVRGGEVILTHNIPEPDPHERPGSMPFRIVRNAAPRGFGANHNAAFMTSRSEYFCVLNPDVRLSADPFPELLGALEAPGVGVAAPLIVSPGGAVEDSARRFHTPFALIRRAFARRVCLDYPGESSAFSPDWVAGMFMLFRRTAFERVGGFDERYFLYYEDVDICARLRLAGYDVRMVPGVRAVHDAQRHSHRDLRYLAEHLRSALRYFTSDAYAGVMRRR